MLYALILFLTTLSGSNDRVNKKRYCSIEKWHFGVVRWRVDVSNLKLIERNKSKADDPPNPSKTAPWDFTKTKGDQTTHGKLSLSSFFGRRKWGEKKRHVADVIEGLVCWYVCGVCGVCSGRGTYAVGRYYSWPS